jgi:citrate synthase
MANMTSPNSQSPDVKQSKVVKGLEGVFAAQTALSLVDGENSRLYYRGISIEEFIGPASFEEVAYLLWYAKLPNAAELKAFNRAFVKEREISKEVLDLIKKFPKKAHPMALLRTAASMLALWDKKADNFDPVQSQKQAISLTAKFPTIIAAFHRLRQGKKPIAPNPKLSHAANFLYMVHGTLPVKEMEEALDTYLILLADHGLNASTFSGRVTSATQSDIYSAVTSAVGTLKGDLHGSANQHAMEMIVDIGTPDKAEAYVNDLLANKKKVMGFGHRIYKKKDPRAEAFRKIARQLCEAKGQTKWLDISNIVEKVMWEKKQIPCNVDFFSASVLYILGFPVDYFTTVFAASRVAGWTAHVIEQEKDNRLIRPSAEYTGPMNEHYIPIEERQ